KAELVARMVLRLYNQLQRHYHPGPPKGFLGIVDVYLCWGGTPGGEQRFDIEKVGKPPRQIDVNTIYIYDLASFKDPVEMAREVAHEYGHAVLPPVGGFGEPEDWGNGDAGERVFMRWLSEEMPAGRMA